MEGRATETQLGGEGPLAHTVGERPGDDETLNQAVEALSGPGGVFGRLVVAAQERLKLIFQDRGQGSGVRCQPADPCPLIPDPR